MLVFTLYTVTAKLLLVNLTSISIVMPSLPVDKAMIITIDKIHGSRMHLTFGYIFKTT